MDAELHELARQQSAICKIFGNPNRLLILWVLAEREHSVSEVASAINASLQNTSQHLRLMQTRGVVESRRQGNVVYYRLARDTLVGCRLLFMAEDATSMMK